MVAAVTLLTHRLRTPATHSLLRCLRMSTTLSSQSTLLTGASTSATSGKAILMNAELQALTGTRLPANASMKTLTAPLPVLTERLIILKSNAFALVTTMLDMPTLQLLVRSHLTSISKAPSTTVSLSSTALSRTTTARKRQSAEMDPSGTRSHAPASLTPPLAHQVLTASIRTLLASWMIHVTASTLIT